MSPKHYQTVTTSNIDLQNTITIVVTCLLCKAFYPYLYLCIFSACYELYVRLGSGSSFEIIDSAENQLTNPVIGELSDF